MTFRGPTSASSPSQGRNSLITKSPPVSAQNEWAERTYCNISPQTPGPGIGQPFSTRHPPTPPPHIPAVRSPDEDSVFTYSPPPLDQPEWEQYYYYPGDTQSVTPGHAMGDSYFAAHSSPSLGLRRQRQTEFADPQHPPPSARPPSVKDAMGEFNLQPPQKPGVGPRRESYMQAAPRSAATSDRDAYIQTSPESAATSGRDAYIQTSPESAATTATQKPAERHRVSVDYGHIYRFVRNSPVPNPHMPGYVDPDRLQQKKRRVPYVKLSELGDPELYSELRNEPSPMKCAVFEAYKERYHKKKKPCCITTGHSYKDKQGNLIRTSTPQISTTRFGVASIAPIWKRDTSSRFYNSQNSSLFNSTGNSSSGSIMSRINKFERGYLSEELESTPVREKIVIDYSKIPPPDYSKKIQRKRPAPVIPIDWVQTLNSRTYTGFIQREDLVVVMFHNSATDQPETRGSLKKHSLKAPSGVNPAFASVDCAKEQKLCASEGINTTPFYKLYSKGSLINTVKDFGLLNY